MKKTTIIVVDDSPFTSKQLKDVVEENGYEVIGYAKNGEEGIAMYDQLHPDIVILDIMLSSLCDSGTLEEVRSVGVKYLIPKPWEDEVLLATLDMLKKHCEEHKED